MSLHIPSDSLSSRQPLPTDGGTTVPNTNSSSPVSDTLSGASDNRSVPLPSNAGYVPLLTAPKDMLSTEESLLIFLSAIRNFKQQFRASVLALLDTMSNYNNLVLFETGFTKKLKFSGMTSLLAEALASGKSEAEIEKLVAEAYAKEKTALLNGQANEILKDKEALDSLIADILKEIASETGQCSALNSEFNDLKKWLDSLSSAVPPGIGDYQITDSSTAAAYNDKVQEYSHAVAKFNAYMAERPQLLKSYNERVSTYNAKVTSFNQTLSSFIKDNSLGKYAEDQGLSSIPLLNPIDDGSSPIKVPPLINPSAIPVIVHIDPPPPFVQMDSETREKQIGKTADLSNYGNKFYNELYTMCYADLTGWFKRGTITGSIDPSLIDKLRESTDKSLQAQSDVLNSKALTRLLFITPGFIKSVIPIERASSSMNAHLILGKAIFQEIMEERFKAQRAEKREDGKQELNTEKLANKLLTFSLGLLGNRSIQSLLPSLGIIADSITSLPKDSPAFAILFAVSFANRIQENVNHGVTETALREFIKDVPELAGLRDEDITKLAAGVNLGQLLTALKLIEENLGLQGLTEKILPALSENNDPTNIVTQARNESGKDRIQLQTDVKDHFIGKGYTQEQSQYLADTAVAMSQFGLSTPNLTSNITSNRINLPLLQSSLASSLILSSNYSPDTATQFARNITENTFESEPFATPSKFLEELNTQLSFRVNNSDKIAKQAIFIPIHASTLTSTANFETLQPTQTQAYQDISDVSTSSPIDERVMSLDELGVIVQEMVYKILSPQLQKKKAQEISQEITESLFGNKNNPNASSGVVKALADQLEILEVKGKTEQKWSDGVHESFRETIKPMMDFYTFSKKLMSPANLHIFFASVYYGDNQTKKNIDINVKF